MSAIPDASDPSNAAGHKVSRWRYHSSRLITRLVFFGVVLIAGGSLARLVVVQPILRNSIQELLAAQQFSAASYVAQEIDGKIRERQARLQRMARSVPMDTQSMGPWLEDRQNFSPLFSQGLMVLDSDGRVVATTGHSRKDATKGYGKRDWFLAVKNSGLPAIGAPSLESGVPVLIMAAPVHAQDGHLRGVLVGTTALSAPGFLDVLQQNKIGEHGGFLLVSPRDQMFVTGTNMAKTLEHTPPPGVNLLHDQAMAGYRGTGITRNAQGEEELSAMVSVPTADWFLVARVPTSEAFQIVTRLRHLLIIVGLATMVIIGLLVYFAMRYLLRPLSLASQQVRDMAEGRQPLRPLVVVRPDEVGDLTAGFNYLLAKLQEREASLARLAHQDPLTGLPNRAAFLERLEQTMALARRQQSRAALLFIDLDRFKPVNDAHGHEAGDQVLQEVALRLRSSVRQTDLVGRLGGDEFLVLLSDVDSSESVTRIAQKCIDAMATPFHLGELTFSIGASVGIAIFPDHGRSGAELIARADAAMYDAKNKGRNTYRIAGPNNIH
ncbi:MAG TPA: GGDEF domain-containing protein [Rhodocyclaceae bacterium]|nr:GGDEF domain-containing protein [Rhodocyclaceae bacterium]